MQTLRDLFTRHPQSVGETYTGHFATATGFGWRMISCGFACLLHAVFPFWFKDTASQEIKRLHDRMVVNRAHAAASTPAPAVAAAPSQLDRVLIGFAACAALAALAIWAAPVTGAPAMLLALVLGLGVRALAPGATMWATPGVRFSGRTILRIGVALLGLRLVLGDIAALGASSFAVVLGAVSVTVIGGFLLARAFGNARDISAISATSVAICGASAALAASAVAPKREGLERETILVVIIVSLLSTAAMIVYPWIANTLHLNGHSAAVLIGAAIHDVAQVAGAGFAMSPEIGVESVTVKLMRVTLLFPVVAGFGYMLMRGTGERAAAGPPVPMFLLAFLALAMIASLGIVPQPVLAVGSQAATFALAIAVAALGATTSFADLRSARPALVGTILAQTLLQLAVVTALVLALT
jgi:uncharacterized integral membrane protein (TIGR00698 family)